MGNNDTRNYPGETVEAMITTIQKPGKPKRPI